MTTTLPVTETERIALNEDVGGNVRKAGGSLRNRATILGLVGLVGGLLIWQIAAWLGWIDVGATSSPIRAFGAVIEMFGTPDIWEALGGTMSSFGIGIAISIVIAIPLGLIIGRVPVLRELTDPWVSIFYSVPYVVFLPLVIFWFGIDTGARVVLIVWSAALPLLIATIGAARNLSANYLAVAKVFSASPLFTLRTVVFPATLPYVLSGVRLAVGRGFVGAIVAELFLGAAGLGTRVQLQTSNYQMDQAMGTIVIIAVIAILIYQIVGLIERLFASWADSSV